MKKMYAVVLGDDDGKSIDSEKVFSLERGQFAADNQSRRLNERNMKCYSCEVMVDIVRVSDGRD